MLTGRDRDPPYALASKTGQYLTLNQPGSGKCVKYRGPFCFDLAFTRCKLTSPGIFVTCHKALRFRKSAQNGAAPVIQ